jgi:mRNA-degrading endonuclease RelE of RelBE toxin-antitoxin system
MSRKYRTTSTFERGFKKLSIPDKDEAFEAISELQGWPDIPKGRNIEKLYAHGDGHVYSLRVTHHIRMIVQVIQDGSFRLRAIGPHDEVYRDL